MTEKGNTQYIHPAGAPPFKPVRRCCERGPAEVMPRHEFAMCEFSFQKKMEFVFVWLFLCCAATLLGSIQNVPHLQRRAYSKKKFVTSSLPVQPLKLLIWLCRLFAFQRLFPLSHDSQRFIIMKINVFSSGNCHLSLRCLECETPLTNIQGCG